MCRSWQSREHKLGRFKLDQDMLGLSSILERKTGVSVKDCFQEDGVVYFIVPPGQLGKALGRGGENIRALQNHLGKKIKVIEFREQVADFVRNVIYPLKVEGITEDDEAILIKDSNYQTKSVLIGREGKNLRVLNRAVQRFFGKEVKVV